MTSSVSLLSSQTTLASSSTSTSSDSTTSSATDAASSEEDLFLNVLLTELQNQSPLDPVDTTEYTSQLVQYSSLEQQIGTNSKLDDIISSMNSSNAFSALSYAGTNVDVNSDTSVVQDDAANWKYALSDSASNVTLTVTDADGNTVETDTLGAQDAGTYDFSLDATQYGLAAGTPLTLSVSATDSSGNAITSDIASNVNVDSVSTDGSGDITLYAGSYSFSADDVTALNKSA